MGTKQNPGQFDCYENAKDDEPMFVLLARDPLAPQVVEFWANLKLTLKPPPQTLRTLKKSTEAMGCARSMKVWKEQNPDV